MMRSTWTQDPTGRIFPEAIKWLLIVNGAVFLLQNLLAGPRQSIG
ncbi:MAG: hypothetical protein P8Y29_10460 [Gemmatimonadota bacterium]